MWFRNLPLKYKTIWTSIVFFLLPLVTYGFFSYTSLTKVNVQNSIDRNIDLMQRLTLNTDDVMKTAEGLKDVFLRNGWMWKYGRHVENAHDYSRLASWFDDYVQNKDEIVCFQMIRDHKLLFERGKVSGLIGEYAEEINGDTYGDGWSSPVDLKTVFHGIQQVVKYTYSFGTDASKPLLTLVVYVSVDAVQQTYAPYLSPDSLCSFLVRNDGTILLGQNVENAEIESIHCPVPFTQNSEYCITKLNKEEVVLYYSRVGERNLYLVNAVPISVYRLQPKASVRLLGIALTLGILFSLACILIQHHYIISPIRKMMEEMEKYREGTYLPVCTYNSKDEIGIIDAKMVKVFQRIDELIVEVYQKTILNQEASLQMLTSQINPHFIYNTLDSIHWLAIRNKDYEVGEQLEALSDLFRHVLSQGKDMVYLQEEIEQIQNYLSLMKFRYGNRLKSKVMVDPKANSVVVPKLILQPLVENAILHGIEPKVSGGCVSVLASIDNDTLVMTVTDDGVGTAEENIRTVLNQNEESFNLFALRNINQRIRLIYGREYGLDFHSKIGEGTTVRLRIPLEETK